MPPIAPTPWAHDGTESNIEPTSKIPISRSETSLLIATSVTRALFKLTVDRGPDSLRARTNDAEKMTRWTTTLPTDCDRLSDRQRPYSTAIPPAHPPNLG